LQKNKGHQGIKKRNGGGDTLSGQRGAKKKGKSILERKNGERREGGKTKRETEEENGDKSPLQRYNKTGTKAGVGKVVDRGGGKA